MTLRRWEPFNELRRMEDVLDRVWAGFRPSRLVERWGEEGWLPLDVYQTEDSLVIKAPVPGVRPGDIEATIEGNVLTLRGEAKAEEKVERSDFLLQERSYGSFCRSVTLPTGLDVDKAEASYEDGVLTLSIPRRAEAKPKSIKINVAKAIEGERR